MAGDSRNKCGRKLRMTEDIMNDHLPHEEIGTKWKHLARQLKFQQAAIDTIESDRGASTNECCIAVIVRWINERGEDATVEKFDEVLRRIGLRNVAEKLQESLSSPEKEEPGANSPNQIENRMNEMEKNWGLLKKELQDKIQELEKENQSITQENLELEKEMAILKKQLQDTSHAEENQKLHTRNLELEEELARVKQQLQDTSQKFLDRTQELNKENQSITQGNLELEQKLAMVKQQLQDFKTSHAQEDLEDNFDMSHRENDSEDTRDDAAREVDEKLKDLNQQLHRKVTSLLQVPEVKEDKLRVPVTLDLLKRLSVSLQELYSSVLSMAAETFKCSEKVKREFYDFAYHGIRAEHNDLVHRVEDLATAQEEMTDEEKKDFGKLQKLQTNRQREVDKLENLWKGLFSPALQPESLPPSSYSAPCGATCYSEKDSRRKCTDPIAQPKSRVRLGEQNTSPVAKTMRKDKKFGRRFTNMKKTFFGKKRSEENMCRLMSYSAMNHRDS